MLKNAHLPRFPHPEPFTVPAKLRISGALHLGIFEHLQQKRFLQSVDTVGLHDLRTLKTVIPPRAGHFSTLRLLASLRGQGTPKNLQ